MHTRRDWMYTIASVVGMTPPRSADTIHAFPGITLLRLVGTRGDGRQVIAMITGCDIGWVLRQDAAGRNYAKVIMTPISRERAWGSETDVVLVQAEILWDLCGVGRVAFGELPCDGYMASQITGLVPTSRIPLSDEDVFGTP